VSPIVYPRNFSNWLPKTGLFSAVSSAFVLGVQPKFESDPNEESAALRAILLTLNQSVISGEIPTVPPVQGDHPSEIVTVTGLVHAGLLISLLAAFVAMFGKQWLNRYLRNAGGSMIERCGDRQRNYDGLNRWPFHLFVESLPIMLQIALLLLACGLCRYMWSINTSIAVVLIVFTVSGVLFYLGIIIAGTCSYECPFQTPASASLSNLWEKVGPDITVALRLTFASGAALYNYIHWSLMLSVLRRLWGIIQCQMLRVLLRLPRIKIPYHFHSSSLPVVQLTPQERTPWSAPLYSIWENIQCKVLRLALRLPQTPPPQIIPDTTLNTLRDTSAGDVRCVSWIL